MAKTYVGIDIGYNCLKLALVQGKKVKKTAVAPMPEKMVQQGSIVSVEAMGEHIRSIMKENGIHCNSAAVVLSNENVFIRNVTMPIMSAQQLLFNLPYEFRDYITEEFNNYTFDYAMLTDADELIRRANNKNNKNSKTEEKTSEYGGEEPEEDSTMELLAVAVSKALLEDFRVMIKRAGMHFEIAAPSVSAYVNLLRTRPDKEEECCILDLGSHSIRMYMFKGDRHSATREIETGLSVLDDAIADAYNVDVHLAHTYLITNHEDCQNSEVCSNIYSNIAVELMRAVNFYRFSNPESNLQNMYICGGGTLIEPLIDVINRTLDINIQMASSLVPDGDSVPDCDLAIQAIGLAMS